MPHIKFAWNWHKFHAKIFAQFNNKLSSTCNWCKKIHMIFISFSCQIRMKFFSHVVWNFSTFFSCEIYYLHEISHWNNMNLMRKFFASNSHQNIFVRKWHEKIFTRNSYVIRVKMIRTIFRMKFMRGTFGCVDINSLFKCFWGWLCLNKLTGNLHDKN